MALIKKMIRMKKKKGNDIILSYPQTVDENVLVDSESMTLKAKLGQLATKSEIPASLPANGGNADTVDGKHASDFATKTHTHVSTDITALDASKLTGTIDIARLPQGALERLTIVTNDTARFSLTSATVQVGDTVKVTATGNLYYVKDDTKLNSEAGYEPYSTGTASSVPWTGVTSKPTTLSGYGISDSVPSRMNGDKYEIYNGTGWVEASTGGGGIAPGDVSNIALQVGNTQLTIKWTDPNNTVVDGNTISAWAGTKLVRKAGSYPTSATDGVVILDSKTRNAYSSTGFTDSGLTNGTVYFYQLFPYNTTGAVNTNTTNRVSGTPQPFKIFGVRIDLANSNPATAVTYTDDAVGMTGGSASWDTMPIFKDIKPCLLLNGVVQGYLNPNDFTKWADGHTPVPDITSGAAGDVMIEIPKTGFTITTTGNYLDIKVTDNPNNAAFKYYAHSRTTEGDKNKLYISAYEGNTISSKLRSLSGKTPTVSQTIGVFRTQAQANGSGYDLVSFYPLTLLQCLFVVRYKSLDSQTAIGQGYTNGSGAQTTGATNANGMNYGTTSATGRMKFLGIEDFSGNVWDWIDGLFCDGSWNILTAFKSFNDTGSGYTNRGKGASANLGGYLSKPQGTSEMGFTAKEVSGSTTTYFCDYSSLCAGCLPFFGGGWGYGADAGVFFLDVYCSASDSHSNVGGRLMYL